MKKILLTAFIILCAGFVAFAVESSKPDTHTNAWGVLHGKQARVNDKECLTCHTDRLECIMCHEDTKPRSHNATWTTKTHGMESRWNSNACKTCHQEEFCTECHETSVPMSHRVPNFGPNISGVPGTNGHCTNGCQAPIGLKWTTSPAKNCLLCHKTRPIISTGANAGKVHAP